MTLPTAITPEIAAAYSYCKRKAFLLLQGVAGDAPHEYVKMIDECAASNLDRFLASFQSTNLDLKPA